MKEVSLALMCNQEAFAKHYEAEFSRMAERYDKYGTLRGWVPLQLLWPVTDQDGLVLIFDHALVRVSARWTVLDTIPVATFERTPGHVLLQ